MYPPSPIPVDRFFAPAEGRSSGPVPPTNPLKIKDGNLKLPRKAKNSNLKLVVFLPPPPQNEDRFSKGGTIKMQDIFPRNLSAFRRKAGYTQEGLAEALGVSRQAVGKWESGQALPEAATLLTLADLLNCSLDALMREPLAEEGLLPASSAEDPRQRTYDAYHAHVGTFARSVALGVFLLLMGMSLTALTAALAAAEAASIWPPLSFSLSPPAWLTTTFGKITRISPFFSTGRSIWPFSAKTAPWWP